MSFITRRRVTRAALLLALVPAFAACDDDPTEPEEELPTSMELTVGNQTVTVTNTGAVTGGPILLGIGASAVSAVFFDADGAEMDLSDEADELELRIVPASTALVTFVGTGAFSGTLTGVAIGSTSVSVSLFHIVENHNDFGEFPVAVTVQ